MKPDETRLVRFLLPVVHLNTCLEGPASSDECTGIIQSSCISRAIGARRCELGTLLIIGKKIVKALRVCKPDYGQLVFLNGVYLT